MPPDYLPLTTCHLPLTAYYPLPPQNILSAWIRPSASDALTLALPSAFSVVVKTTQIRDELWDDVQPKKMSSKACISTLLSLGVIQHLPPATCLQLVVDISAAVYSSWLWFGSGFFLEYTDQRLALVHAMCSFETSRKSNSSTEATSALDQMNTLIVKALHRLPVEQHSTSLGTPFVGRGPALQDGWSRLFKRATQLVAGGGGGGGGSSDSRNGGDGDDGNGTGKDCDDSGNNDDVNGRGYNDDIDDSGGGGPPVQPPPAWQQPAAAQHRHTFRQEMRFALAASQVEADTPCRRLPVEQRPKTTFPAGDAVRSDDADGVGCLKLADLSPQLDFDRSVQQGTICNHEGIRIAGAIYDPSTRYAMAGTELNAHPDSKARTRTDRLPARVMTVSVAGLEPRSHAMASIQ